MLDAKSRVCPTCVQYLSNLCQASVHVQVLSSRCPPRVKGWSTICQGPVHLKTLWTEIGRTLDMDMIMEKCQLRRYGSSVSEYVGPQMGKPEAHLRPTCGPSEAQHILTQSFHIYPLSRVCPSPKYAQRLSPNDLCCLLQPALSETELPHPALVNSLSTSKRGRVPS